MILGRTVNYRRIRNAVAAHRARAVWTPAALFAQGQQGVWYEPKPEYLFQDAAGTIPVTADGDPVGRMLDLSPNGNHAKQETSAARPVYRTNGTLHWLQFDGVDDRLIVSLWAGGDIPQPTTQSWALEIKSRRTGIIVSSPNTSKRHQIGQADAGDEVRIFAGSELRGSAVSPPLPASIYRAVVNGTASQLWHQGALAIQGNAGDMVSSGLVLGATLSGAAPSLFDMYGGVFVSGMPSEIDKAEQYLAKLAGVTL